MVPRKGHQNQLEGLLQRHPVVAVLGARQVGKPTLARLVCDRFDGPTTTFDLENPAHVARFEDAMLALEGLEGLVVIDEIQSRPELFPVLRVLADRSGPPARFLVLGSASPHLLQQSSETLAGRIAYYQLDGFMVDEVGGAGLQDFWLRGRFPRSFLAEFKRTVAPKVTRSMRIALSDLQLDRIDVVHAGEETFPLAEEVRAVGLERVWEDLEPL